MASTAQALRHAFSSQTVLALTSEQTPKSQEEAARVRDEAAVDLRPVKAWKLGATIAAVRANLGLEQQFFGLLPAALVYQDGAEVGGFHARLQGVESEYAFELARDLSAEDAEREDLTSLFSCVRPAIEIPGTRYASLGLYGGFGLVADFGAAGALVLGPACELKDVKRYDTAPVRLSFGGEPAATGSAEVIDGGAMGPIRIFLRQALAAGHALQKGQAIVTGSCTGYVKAPAGEEVVAAFDALGASVRLTFVPSA